MCFGFGWRKTRECEKSSSCLCKDGHVYYVSSRGSSVSRGINELTREHNGRQNAEYLLAYDANATSLLCMTITLPNSSLPMGVVYHSFQSTRLLSYTDIILFLLFESLLVRSSIEYILFFFLQLSIVIFFIKNILIIISIFFEWFFAREIYEFFNKMILIKYTKRNILGILPHFPFIKSYNKRMKQQWSEKLVWFFD